MKLMTQKEIGSVAREIAGDISKNKYLKIGFIGPLGAGKTTLIKEILFALSVEGDTSSPTFTLLKEYKSKRVSICHIDLYRVDQNDRETIDMLVDAIDANNIALVEWVDKSDKISAMMDVIYSIGHSDKKDTRLIERLSV